VESNLNLQQEKCLKVVMMHIDNRTNKKTIRPESFL